MNVHDDDDEAPTAPPMVGFEGLTPAGAEWLRREIEKPVEWKFKTLAGVAPTLGEQIAEASDAAKARLAAMPNNVRAEVEAFAEDLRAAAWHTLTTVDRVPYEQRAAANRSPYWECRVHGPIADDQVCHSEGGYRHVGCPYSAHEILPR